MGIDFNIVDVRIFKVTELIQYKNEAHADPNTESNIAQGHVDQFEKFLVPRDPCDQSSVKNLIYGFQIMFQGSEMAFT